MQRREISRFSRTRVKSIDLYWGNVIMHIAGRTSKKLRSTPRTEELEYPEEPDELFFQEVLFNQHCQEIRGMVYITAPDKVI